MAVRKLVEQGIVEIVHPGSRTRSNRYRIRIEILREVHQTVQGSEDGFTTPRSEGGFTRVVKSNVEGGEAGMPDVVNPASPESVYESERKRRNEIDRSQAEGGALALGPGGPSLARQPNGVQLRYPEFWEAVGRRVTVFESEVLIDGLLTGKEVEYAAIVEGAKRWRRYSELVKSKRVLAPRKWLEQRKWQDDWEPPRGLDQAGEKSSTPQKSSGSATSPKKRKKTRNPEHKKWERELAVTEAPVYQLDREIKNHLKVCKKCEGDPTKPDFKRCPGLVELARAYRMHFDRVEAWRRENRAPSRWCYVD